MENVWPAIGALVPSIGVLALFIFVIRRVIQADRRERQAMASLDAEDARAAESTTP